MKKQIYLSLMVVGVTMLGACKTPEEKVVTEKQEAVKEVTKAQQDLGKVRQEEAKKIAETQGAKKVEDAKIEATENIAEANKVVQDEKIEATKEVVDAEQDAKKDTAPTNVP